jgi:hypothetical protein
MREPGTRNGPTHPCASPVPSWSRRVATGLPVASEKSTTRPLTVGAASTRPLHASLISHELAW